MRHERVSTGAATGRGWRGLVLAALAGGLLPFMVGCETDSFLYDPSVLGRWEHTPTTVPILTRIASIEGPADEWMEFDDPTPADLIPEIAEYRIGPGDRLSIVVFDIPEDTKAVPYDKIVDTRGHIELPQLGQINVSGLTATGAADLIKERMRTLVREEPLATVDVVQPRQQRITIIGSVQASGPYTVPSADYRLLEALAAAGSFSEAPEYIYVIRQTPLTDAASGQPAQSPGAKPEPTPQAPSGEKLLDIIDEISGQGGQPAPSGPTGPTGPATPPPAPAPAAPTGTPAQPPQIDLIDPAAPAAPAAKPAAEAADTSWVHLDGKWVRVRTAAPVAPAAQPGASPAAAEMQVTQRVIRVPVGRLVNGDARVNIVVRPGDVIRVPPPPAGNVFVGGQVNRGGVYQMTHGLTFSRIITAAGGLSAIAVPERVDLVRIVGPDRQATIRVNARAIAEGTHPDILLKPNDHIVVGSNFWAVPLAVIRNGFRASYGFGFLLDRNFGNDVFGAPPGERFF